MDKKLTIFTNTYPSKYNVIGTIQFDWSKGTAKFWNEEAKAYETIQADCIDFIGNG